MARDPWGGERPDQADPCTRHYTVTPGGTDLDPVPRALFLPAGGDVTITDSDGTSIAYAGLPAGIILPFRAIRVTAASETVVAWW